MGNEQALKQALTAILGEITRTRDRLGRLETAANELRSLIGLDIESVPEDSLVAVRRSPGTFESMNSVEAVRVILTNAGHPLTMRKIAEALFSGGYSNEHNVRKIYSNVYGSVKRRDDVFVRLNDNPVTYGLVGRDDHKLALE